jgi:hypothetical protein
MTACETLPKELINLLSSPQFDDEAGILIESVSHIQDDISITISIRFEPGDIINELWQVTLSKVECVYINRNWTQDIAIYKEHAMLLEY